MIIYTIVYKLGKGKLQHKTIKAEKFDEWLINQTRRHVVHIIFFDKFSSQEELPLDWRED